MTEMMTSNAPTPAETGLRSPRGIRWLLLAGALVTGVSVYRLVEAQWTAIPVPVQFLVLVAGALAIHGIGRVTRSRLHLPYAGSALLFLFTGLVPVLAWGASYLHLLDSAWGWLAFGAGGAVLLGAAAGVMRSELRYSGRLYPVALGTLFVAQAALPWVGSRWPWTAGSLYLTAALGLGAVLHLGSRHINRFFFHRDRLDGRERTVHGVPFLLLSVLYGGSLAGLDWSSPLRAIPLALVGLVLATTGEEYYRALSRSLGHTPERWPRRSMALMGVGLSLVVAALPLALEDPSGHSLLLTSTAAAVLFLSWSLRYETAVCHVLGVLAALLAWNNLPPLAPLRQGGPALLGWNEAGFLLGLLALGEWLGYRGASSGLRRTQALLTALLLAIVSVAAFFELSQGTLLLAVAGAAGLVAGYRQREAAPFFGGAVMLSLAAHAEILLRQNGPGLGSTLLTQALFALCWGAAHRLPSFRGSLRILAAFHGLTALGWLGWAVLDSSVTIEPLILFLAGSALLGSRLAEHRLTADGGIDLGLVLALAWGPVQLASSSWVSSWSAALVAGLTLAGLELSALTFAARRAPGLWVASRFQVAEQDWVSWVSLSLRGVTRLWLVMAAAACLLFTGWDALLLAATLVAVRYLSRTELEGWARRFAFPARLTLLPLLQLAVLAAAGGRPERDLPSALLALGVALLLPVTAFALAWRGLVERLGLRRSLERWSLGLQAGVACGYLTAFFLGTELSPWTNAALITLATAWAGVAFFDAWRDHDSAQGWLMQGWAGVAVLHGFTAGWLYLGSGVAPYVLLAAGAGAYALGAVLQKRGPGGAAVAPSCQGVGLALPLGAGVLSVLRYPGSENVWLPALATFLVSLFYAVVALRESRRLFPATASAAFLAWALVNAVATAGLGRELYCLAPGLGLLLLSALLRGELGTSGSRRMAAAGASFVYATPIVALSNEISWGWLALLLVLSVAFGAASFSLRSRSLLTVSTAALLTDLGFFVFRIGTTAPMVLWVLGLGFGLTLMGSAAWLEYRREGVLQQIRVFGRELRSWS